MSTAKGMAETVDAGPLRERAFALYCQGQRSPAIAAALGVSERTVRAWVSGALRKLAEESAAQRRDRQTLAIARYQAIATAAWEGYARIAAIEAATLEACVAAGAAEETPGEAAGVKRAVSPAGARYLAVAMAADREICRLQGLYLPEATKPHNDVKIIIERREPTAENYPPGEYPGAPTSAFTAASTAASTAADGADSLCDGMPRGADDSAAVLTPDSPAKSATPLASAADPAALAAPSTVPPANAPIPGMPRMWKRYSSRYPNSRLPGLYVTYD